MPTWITVVFILLIAATLASFLIGRGRRTSLGNRAAGAGYESGTMTVTGVSSRGAADKNGRSYLTVSGTIIGPETAPTEVYGSLVLEAGEPDLFIGQELPVAYKPGKAATSWRLTTDGQ